MIEAINGTSADQLTLSALGELLEKPATYTLRIRRGAQTLTVTLAPRRLI